jgi:hypothetical protein
VEWLAIASASAAVACLIGWGASIATPKAGFIMTFPSEFGLSVSDGLLEFGQGLGRLRDLEYYDTRGAGSTPGWRLLGLGHRSYDRLYYDNFSAKLEKAGCWSITSVSLLFPGALFGLAAWWLVRSCRRMRAADRMTATTP